MSLSYQPPSMLSDREFRKISREILKGENPRRSSLPTNLTLNAQLDHSDVLKQKHREKESALCVTIHGIPWDDKYLKENSPDSLALMQRICSEGLRIAFDVKKDVKWIWGVQNWQNLLLLHVRIGSLVKKLEIMDKRSLLQQAKSRQLRRLKICDFYQHNITV